jgi:DNA polymerase alpha subunit A
MYGCLGLEISRFYALGIASLITSKGREILQKSIKLVTDMGYDVVYGDTDSMMINPKKNEFRDVIATGLQI